MILETSKLSENSLEIFNKKEEGWSHFLFANIILDDIELIKRKKDDTTDSMLLPHSDFTNWINTKKDFLDTISENLYSVLMYYDEKNSEAFGSSGYEGNYDTIVELSRKFSNYYLDLHKWIFETSKTKLDFSELSLKEFEDDLKDEKLEISDFIEVQGYNFQQIIKEICWLPDSILNSISKFCINLIHDISELLKNGGGELSLNFPFDLNDRKNGVLGDYIEKYKNLLEEYERKIIEIKGTAKYKLNQEFKGMREDHSDTMGHIYALINPSFVGLIKVGKTTRDPYERAREISSSTGVPTPFVVAFSLTVPNCDIAEYKVHRLLEKSGYRVSTNREFFNAPLEVVVNSMMEVKRDLLQSITNEDPPLQKNKIQASDE